jgi:uncharacterized protein with PIN domain
MKKYVAHFRFYEELNDFLPGEIRKKPFEYRFTDRTAVKDMIEGIGVPHTEIDLILVNGESVDFTYIVEDGDRIGVYPTFEAVDITNVVKLRPKPLRETKFVADIHLGKLAGLLRMLGFDTLYRNDYPDEELARISSEEHRILLTKDRNLLKRNLVTHGCYVRDTDPRRQIIEILDRLDLRDQVAPFKRCLCCNRPVEPANVAEVRDRLDEKTLSLYNEFYVCRKCDKVYWKGSHYDNMKQLIDEITKGGGFDEE